MEQHETPRSLAGILGGKNVGTPDEDHTIPKPEDYEFWRRYQADFWPGPQLGWVDTNPETLEPRFRPLFARRNDQPHADDLWHYRRIFYHGHYPADLYPSDITLVNWPQNDYWLGPLVGISQEEKQKHLRAAKQLSLSLLYWMQTQAPRLDGGYGYPGLRLRHDVVGTRDAWQNRCVSARVGASRRNTQ